MHVRSIKIQSSKIVCTYALKHTHTCSYVYVNWCLHTITQSKLVSHDTQYMAKALISHGGVSKPLDVTPQLSPALIKPGGGLEGGRRRKGKGGCGGRCQELPCYCGTPYCLISTAPCWYRPTPRSDWHAGSRLLAPYDSGWSPWTGCP